MNKTRKGVDPGSKIRTHPGLFPKLTVKPEGKSRSIFSIKKETQENEKGFLYMNRAGEAKDELRRNFLSP
jgi:hypothetical protein